MQKTFNSMWVVVGPMDNLILSTLSYARKSAIIKVENDGLDKWSELKSKRPLRSVGMVWNNHR